MRNRVFFLFVLMLAAGIAGADAAQDRAGKIDIGGSAAGAFNDTDADDDLWVGANASYGINSWLAIGVEGGWQDASMGNVDSHLGVATIMGDIILRSPVYWDNTVFYAIGGLGVLAAWVEDEFGFHPRDNGDDVDDAGFAGKLGLGVDWFLSDNWILNFEAAYVASSDIELTGTELAGEDNIAFGTVGGGIKYVF